MNTEQIIDILVKKLQLGEVWFTTKADPTYDIPSDYVRLDEYGDIADEKEKEKIAKQILDIVGDGAGDIIEAIDVWMQRALQACMIDFTYNLKTAFKAKPVIDEIEAYQLPTKGSALVAESLDKDGIITDIPEELKEPSKLKPWTEDMWNKYYNECKANYESVFNNSKDEDTKYNNIQFLKGVASRFGLDNLEFTDESYKEDIDKIARAYADNKKQKYNKFVERKKLNESVQSSKKLISDKLQDENFNEETPEGQIIIRTDKLFNMLVKENYNVDVSFDNGESTITVYVGKNNGNIIISIMDKDTRLVPVTNNSIVLDEQNLKTINDIINIIKNV